MTEPGEEQVWSLVMFDLPVKSRPQRGAATAFRNLLLDLGYQRVQLSVYVRYLPMPSAGASALRRIRANLPPGGAVRILNVSDHQWSKAFRFLNEAPEPQEEAPSELLIF